MSKHPLDDAFGVNGTAFADDYEEIKIPENEEDRNLHMVIDFALKQYKMNCDDMALMDAKVRVRVMEINRDLLNVVKDARYKMEVLACKKHGSKSKKDDDTPEVEQGGLVSRDELMRRRNELKAVK